MTATVLAVATDAHHHFSKANALFIDIIAGLGVAHDAHAGVTVQHRSRVAADPTQPNLRQVHLIHAELFDELRGKGFSVRPGDLGENITTHGLDILALPRGTLLHIGDAVLEVTGLRNPCSQIERFQSGLLAAVIDRAPDGTPVWKAGIMTIARQGGTVRPSDPITVVLPPRPHEKLRRV
jgi:MOSC domain-containing protein YiiM